MFCVYRHHARLCQILSHFPTTTSICVILQVLVLFCELWCMADELLSCDDSTVNWSYPMHPINICILVAIVHNNEYMVPAHNWFHSHHMHHMACYFVEFGCFLPDSSQRLTRLDISFLFMLTTSLLEFSDSDVSKCLFSFTIGL